MKQKVALICGIGGQDGSYLAQFLFKKGYSVWGTSRDAQMSQFSNLKKLGVLKYVHLLSMAPNDFRSVLTALKTSEPDEVYFLAAQSSVGLSFEQPVESIESITLGILNLLEAIRFTNQNIKLYHAGSSECFGELGSNIANEKTPFKPRSPYAVAKSSAYWLVCCYRDSYNLFASNGILFNHESPLRPDRFVTKKIISAACRIAKGSNERLILGQLAIVRDWGWAPEYVEAMWQILQHSSADDFIISTGQSYALSEFVEEAFAIHGLDWHEFVDINEEFYRPSEILGCQGDPSKASMQLGWKAKYKMKDVIRMMTDEAMTGLKGDNNHESRH